MTRPKDNTRPLRGTKHLEFEVEHAAQASGVEDKRAAGRVLQFTRRAIELRRHLVEESEQEARFVIGEDVEVGNNFVSELLRCDVGPFGDSFAGDGE
jgi:hypothetical protein